MSDLIERQAAIDAMAELQGRASTKAELKGISKAWKWIKKLPSVQPYTDEEIQKIQELEQAQLDKAFELGKESAKAEIIHCGECKHKGTKNCVANVWAAILGVTVKDDFYCGLAERRTNG